MKRILITALLLLVMVAPAAALPITFNFTFSGLDFENDAVATGSITFESDYLYNPGNNIFILGDPLGFTNAVTQLTVNVTGATGDLGNGPFAYSAFDKVIFDTSLIPLDLTTQLVGQPTASAMTWGTPDPILGSSPPQSYSGDFELSAKIGSGAPTGMDIFQLATVEGNGDDMMQLTSFAPAESVPEPSTFLLLGLGGLGVLGYARRRMTRNEK